MLAGPASLAGEHKGRSSFIVSAFMMYFALLSVLVLFTSLVSARQPVVIGKSIVDLPISRRFNLTGLQNIYRHDFNRAQALKARGTTGAEKRAVITTPADNQVVAYYATIGIGVPATKCESLPVQTRLLLIICFAFRCGVDRYWKVRSIIMYTSLIGTCIYL